MIEAKSLVYSYFNVAAMCQLLGMNCKTPTDICFSFTGFSSRGGDTGEHTDGWGTAFYEPGGLRVFLDHLPASQSNIAKILKTQSIKSLNVLSHIRKANIGEVCLRNTQPFTRELWGKNWTFMHNGDLYGLTLEPNGLFQPVGETDSEKAFCVILNAIRAEFSENEANMEKFTRLLQKTSDQLSEYGIFNFILSDGKYMFAYRYSNLYSVRREYPFTEAKLLDQDITVNFSKTNKPGDRVTVIATQPITENEAWECLTERKITVLKDGVILDM